MASREKGAFGRSGRRMQDHLLVSPNSLPGSRSSVTACSDIGAIHLESKTDEAGPGSRFSGQSCGRSSAPLPTSSVRRDRTGGYSPCASSKQSVRRGRPKYHATGIARFLVSSHQSGRGRYGSRGRGHRRHWAAPQWRRGPRSPSENQEPLPKFRRTSGAVLPISAEVTVASSLLISDPASEKPSASRAYDSVSRTRQAWPC